MKANKASEKPTIAGVETTLVLLRNGWWQNVSVMFFVAKKYQNSLTKKSAMKTNLAIL
jgi:hypothetical protein